MLLGYSKNVSYIKHNKDQAALQTNMEQAVDDGVKILHLHAGIVQIILPSLHRRQEDDQVPNDLVLPGVVWIPASDDLQRPPKDREASDKDNTTCAPTAAEAKVTGHRPCNTTKLEVRSHVLCSRNSDDSHGDLGHEVESSASVSRWKEEGNEERRTEEKLSKEKDRFQELGTPVLLAASSENVKKQNTAGVSMKSAFEPYMDFDSSRSSREISQKTPTSNKSHESGVRESNAFKRSVDAGEFRDLKKHRKCYQATPNFSITNFDYTNDCNLPVNAQIGLSSSQRSAKVTTLSSGATRIELNQTTRKEHQLDLKLSMTSDQDTETDSAIFCQVQDSGSSVSSEGFAHHAESKEMQLVIPELNCPEDDVGLHSSCSEEQEGQIDFELDSFQADCIEKPQMNSQNLKNAQIICEEKNAISSFNQVHVDHSFKTDKAFHPRKEPFHDTEHDHRRIPKFAELSRTSHDTTASSVDTNNKTDLAFYDNEKLKLTSEKTKFIAVVTKEAFISKQNPNQSNVESAGIIGARLQKGGQNETSSSELFFLSNRISRNDVPASMSPTTRSFNEKNVRAHLSATQYTRDPLAYNISPLSNSAKDGAVQQNPKDKQMEVRSERQRSVFLVKRDQSSNKVSQEDGESLIQRSCKTFQSEQRYLNATLQLAETKRLKRKSHFADDSKTRRKYKETLSRDKVSVEQLLSLGNMTKTTAKISGHKHTSRASIEAARSLGKSGPHWEEVLPSQKKCTEEETLSPSEGDLMPMALGHNHNLAEASARPKSVEMQSMIPILDLPQTNEEPAMSNILAGTDNVLDEIILSLNSSISSSADEKKTLRLLNQRRTPESSHQRTNEETCVNSAIMERHADEPLNKQRNAVLFKKTDVNITKETAMPTNLPESRAKERAIIKTALPRRKKAIITRSGVVNFTDSDGDESESDTRSTDTDQEEHILQANWKSECPSSSTSSYCLSRESSSDSNQGEFDTDRTQTLSATSSKACFADSESDIGLLIEFSKPWDKLRQFHEPVSVESGGTRSPPEELSAIELLRRFSAEEYTPSSPFATLAKSQRSRSLMEGAIPRQLQQYAGSGRVRQLSLDIGEEWENVKSPSASNPPTSPPSPVVADDSVFSGPASLLDRGTSVREEGLPLSERTRDYPKPPLKMSHQTSAKLRLLYPNPASSKRFKPLTDERQRNIMSTLTAAELSILLQTDSPLLGLLKSEFPRNGKTESITTARNLQKVTEETMQLDRQADDDKLSEETGQPQLTVTVHYCSQKPVMSVLPMLHGAQTQNAASSKQCLDHSAVPLQVMTLPTDNGVNVNGFDFLPPSERRQLPNPFNRLNQRFHSTMQCPCCFFFCFLCCLPALHRMGRSDYHFDYGSIRHAWRSGRLATCMYLAGTITAVVLIVACVVITVIFLQDAILRRTV